MNKADKDTQIAPEPAEEVVGTAEALENLIKRVKRAQKEFATFSQTQVNAIFKAAVSSALTEESSVLTISSLGFR